MGIMVVTRKLNADERNHDCQFWTSVDSTVAFKIGIFPFF